MALSKDTRALYNTVMLAHNYQLVPPDSRIDPQLC